MNPLSLFFPGASSDQHHDALRSVAGLKKFMATNKWVPGERTKSGDAFGGQLALYTLIHGLAARHPDQIETHLRQLRWVLTQEETSQRSLSDRYWLQSLVERLPNRYSVWSELRRKLEADLSSQANKVAFKDVWEDNHRLCYMPAQLAPQDDVGLITKVLQPITDQLHSCIAAQKHPYGALAKDGQTPLLWDWLTRPGVSPAIYGHGQGWDWDLLLRVKPMSDEEWESLIRHPLSIQALMSSCLAASQHPDRLKNDRPILERMVQSGQKVGLSVTLQELEKDFNGRQRFEFFTTLQRLMALEAGLPAPTSRPPAPRF